MADFDTDWFEERAAISEYDGGLSRFEAETLAAKEQGFQRWEAMAHAKRERDLAATRHHGQAGDGHAADGLSGLQLQAGQEVGPVLEREFQA